MQGVSQMLLVQLVSEAANNKQQALLSPASCHGTSGLCLWVLNGFCLFRIHNVQKELGVGHIHIRGQPQEAQAEGKGT